MGAPSTHSQCSHKNQQYLPEEPRTGAHPTLHPDSQGLALCPVFGDP